MFLFLIAHSISLNVISYITVSTTILLLCLITNIAIILYNRFQPTHIALRSGSLTLFYYLACLIHILIVLVPFVYIIANFNLITIEWTSILYYLSIHSFFWIILLWKTITIRYEYEVPLFLLSCYGVSALLITVPLLFWSNLFPTGFFYIINFK